MMQKSLILAAAAATLACASVTVSSNAEARAYHRIYGYGNFDGYGFAPSYAPRYGYAWRHRYYDRFGSNRNPDRQMVGQGE
jgi:hypothetical protein